MVWSMIIVVQFFFFLRTRLRTLVCRIRSFFTKNISDILQNWEILEFFIILFMAGRISTSKLSQDTKLNSKSARRTRAQFHDYLDRGKDEGQFPFKNGGTLPVFVWSKSKNINPEKWLRDLRLWNRGNYNDVWSILGETTNKHLSNIGWRISFFLVFRPQLSFISIIMWKYRKKT